MQNYISVQLFHNAITLSIELLALKFSAFAIAFTTKSLALKSSTFVDHVAPTTKSLALKFSAFANHIAFTTECLALKFSTFVDHVASATERLAPNCPAFRTSITGDHHSADTPCSRSIYWPLVVWVLDV